METVKEWTAWKVALIGGGTAVFWADEYYYDDRDVVFSAIVQASPHEQALFDVVGDTESDPSRVMIAVARLPRRVVLNIRG